MNSFSEAVKLAIEKGGYPIGAQSTQAYLDRFDGNYFRLMLSSQIWLALGKALNWSDKKFYPFDSAHPHIGEEMPEAKWYFRSFMELKWNGGNEEQFFNELLKGK